MDDIERIQQALQQYYRRRDGGRKRVSISDVGDIDAGTSHDMYCFHLEYIEKVKTHGETLILRMGANKDDLNREFQALEKLDSTCIPVPKVYDTGENMLGSSFNGEGGRTKYVERRHERADTDGGGEALGAVFQPSG